MIYAFINYDKRYTFLIINMKNCLNVVYFNVRYICKMVRVEIKNPIKELL